MVYPYNCILLSKKQNASTPQKTSDICNNMDEFQNISKWKEARYKREYLMWFRLQEIQNEN